MVRIPPPTIITIEALAEVDHLPLLRKRKLALLVAASIGKYLATKSRTVKEKASCIGGCTIAAKKISPLMRGS
jgi:hypothetical protein